MVVTPKGRVGATAVLLCCWWMSETRLTCDEPKLVARLSR